MAMAVFAIAVFFLPSQNLSADAVSYASDAKYGTDLLRPAHLLFSPFMWCVFHLLNGLGIDVEAYRVMQVVNSFFAIGTLMVFCKLLKRLTSETAAVALTIFAGSCFGFLRYTLECEAYIIPLFFSVLSSYIFLLYIEKRSVMNLVLMALTASLACLFHQIHLFWGVGLFAGIVFLKRYRDAALYAVITLVVPAAYALALYIQSGDIGIAELWRFIASYYYSDDPISGIGFKNLVMTPVSFVRSFIQLHGDIAIQLSLKPWLWLFIVALPICMAYLLYKALRSVRRTATPAMAVFAAHLGVFTLQLLFAIYSDGNMEFMVMLPFALIIAFASVYEFAPKYIMLLGSAIFCWNLLFSIIPNRFYNQYDTKAVTSYLYEHQDLKFLGADRLTVNAWYYYQYGVDDTWRFYGKAKGIESGEFVTDIIDRPMPFSRKSFVTDSDFAYDVIDTVKTVYADYGKYHLYKIRVR